MGKIKRYEAIGEIAHNAKAPMTMNELAHELGEEKNGRNMHNYVRGAYNHFSEEDPETAGIISRIFVNENGEYAFM